MATIEKDKQGYRVRFKDHRKRRRAIRLGGFNKSNAEKVARYIEELVSWKISGLPLDGHTSAWLAKMGDELYGKLANAGLVEPRVSGRLGDFVRKFLEQKLEIKAGTRTNIEQVQWNLFAHFGEDRDMRSITSADAIAFRNWLLLDEGLGENTVRRRCGRARQLFRAAQDQRLIESNPFAAVPVSVTGNREKERFVTHEESAKILEKCPDAEWKLIFALCRYGGLRCPSEVLKLKWGDVLWDSQRIVVSSPKTERYIDRDKRIIPMFPELRAALDERWKEAPDESVYCISRYRSNSQNLRTRFNRIVSDAGITPWAKPFQNLRATRETELMEEYPTHVVLAWIGHTEKVARRHYLQVTDSHFERATGGGAQAGAKRPRNAEKAGAQKRGKR